MSRPAASERRLMSCFGTLLIGVFAAISSLPAESAVPIENAPLYVGNNVPGNLALVPSVEYPTIISQANIGNYDVGRAYMGYFDSAKCYVYVYNNTEALRHFRPSSMANARTCAGATEWSGNYLNWAATQTIDPFRLALTGGYRVVDTATETWLETSVAA